MSVGEPVAKRRRFSPQPDLEVEVEGEVFPVHSYVLTSRSPVFAAMLDSGMCESQEGRIRLKGKSKAEFCEFLRHLDNGSAELPEITGETVPRLLHWADEYGVDGLRQRCEAFLLKQPADGLEALKQAVRYQLAQRRDQCVKELTVTAAPAQGAKKTSEQPAPAPQDRSVEELLRWCEECDVKGLRDRCEAFLLKQPAGDPEALSFATKYGLERRREQCVKTFALPFNLHKHRQQLLEFKDDTKVVQEMVPALYKAVWLNSPRAVPEKLTLEIAWPIVMRALELVDGWRSWEEMQAYAKNAAAMERLVKQSLPNHGLSGWELAFVSSGGTLLPTVWGTDEHIHTCSAASRTKRDKAQVDEMIHELHRIGVLKKSGERHLTRDDYEQGKPCRTFKEAAESVDCERAEQVSA